MAPASWSSLPDPSRNRTVSQTIALIAVLVAWTSTTFLLLQLWTTGARRALLAPALVSSLVAPIAGRGTTTVPDGAIMITFTFVAGPPESCSFLSRT